MFEKLKQNWKEIGEDSPGKRFRNQYKRRQKSRKNTLQKIGMVGSGVLIIGAGIFFLPAPGPGMLIILIGLALISREFLTLARFLDWLEIRVRRWAILGKTKWEHASMIFKIVFVFTSLMLFGALGIGTYLLFYAP